MEPIKLKICFVTHNFYPVLSYQNDTQSAGGAELQQRFIGEALKKRGYSVSYISMDIGQNDLELIDGFEIYKTYKLNEGIRGIRFVYPVFYKLWRSLKKANADVYYVRCAGFLPGIVALFCKSQNRKMIFAGAHDTDFIPDQFLLTKHYEKLFYRYGLRRADAIIVQSKNQKSNLWDHFKLEGEVVRNFFPYSTKQISAFDQDIVLWVSTMRPWKKPMHFIRLAEKFPDENFVMIGGRPGMGDTQLYDDVKEKAKKLNNLQFLGFQPFHKTEDYFDRCSLFVNTSEYEGFPNTFLQAWNRGVPVLSYVDPDGIISKHNLGMVVTSENELETALSSFVDSNARNTDGIRAYFNQNHSNKVIKKYDTILRAIAKTAKVMDRSL